MIGLDCMYVVQHEIQIANGCQMRRILPDWAHTLLFFVALVSVNKLGQKVKIPQRTTFFVFQSVGHNVVHTRKHRM